MSRYHVEKNILDNNVFLEELHLSFFFIFLAYKEDLTNTFKLFLRYDYQINIVIKLTQFKFF